MDLICVLEHMRGKVITIDGSDFQIDVQGQLLGLPKEAASKLLGGRSWEPLDGKGPAQVIREARDRKLQIAKAKVTMQSHKDKGLMDEVAPIVNDTESKPEPKKTMKVSAKASLEKSIEAEIKADEAKNEDGSWNDYPEPSEDLGLEKLREMADVYKVKYNHRTSKKLLVQRLNKAMF